MVRLSLSLVHEERRLAFPAFCERGEFFGCGWRQMRKLSLRDRDRDELKVLYSFHLSPAGMGKGGRRRLFLARHWSLAMSDDDSSIVNASSQFTSPTNLYAP